RRSRGAAPENVTRLEKRKRQSEPNTRRSEAPRVPRSAFHGRRRLCGAVVTAPDAGGLDLGLAVGDGLLVDLRLGGAGGDELVGLGLLLVDELLEVLDGLGAREEAAVDEERRGAASAERGALGLLLDDLLLEGRVGHVLLELLDVEAELTGPGDVVLVAHGLLVLEDL